MPLSFRKMHGLGNDFVIIDQRDGAPSLPAAEIVRLGDRRHGIGFDQIVFLKTPRAPQADIFLDLYNADGTSVEACGNATRCVARLLMEEKGKSSCVIETVAGLLPCAAAADGMVSVDMGVPRFDWREIPLAEARDTLDLGAGLAAALPGPVAVNVGNPHAVFFVGDVESVDLATLGPRIEHHPLFPQRINVEFAQVLSPGKIRMRVWERGTGITQACGTGACAVLVAAARRGLSDAGAEIVLDGGSLHIAWDPDDKRVRMTGAATKVFTGEIC